jgi:hypothetical protein
VVIAMDDKVIVTNWSRLETKYGAAGVKAVDRALKALVRAGEKRGIKTQLVGIDDLSRMKELSARPVTKHDDEKQVKAAIDAVFAALKPDYLMILGAVDVIPHQRLGNPLFDPPDDDDRDVPSDLPYACEQRHSSRIQDFLGPTRVIGRLPNVTGDRDPAYLIGLINAAASWKARPAEDYSRYFAVSADVWRESTRRNLDTLFGNTKGLRLSPTGGPKWTQTQLGARTHFINCHGSRSDPHYYGQRGEDFPIAHKSAWLAKRIEPGCIASVECCYGAQLYDAVTLGLDLPIGNAYLGRGAYGFFGSTTIAYGPAEENDQADLICQYFLEVALKGASLGRAALQARQRFVQQAAQMDPVNLKTLAQFILLGDPSIHPVATSRLERVRPLAGENLARAERRASLSKVGRFLEETTARVEASERKATKSVRDTLARIAAQSGLRTSSAQVFDVFGGRVARGGKAARAFAPSAYHLIQGRSTACAKEGFAAACIVAKEVGGNIVDWRVYHRR